MNASYKVLLKMIQLILYTCLVMHMLACMWYRVCLIEEKWMLNMDFIWSTNSRRFEIYFPDNWVR